MEAISQHFDAPFFPLDLLLSQHCFDVFVKKQDFSDQECVSQTMTKAIGWAVVLSSAILKLPIIFNMLKTKSAEGLSATSLYIDTSSYTVLVIYNLAKATPISTWGELPVLILQNVAIVLLMLWFYREDAHVVQFNSVMITLFALFLALAMMLPEEHHYLLTWWSIGCAAAAKVPQIVRNFKQGHTGVLSLATLLLQCAGGGLRLYTVFMEVDDLAVRATNLTAFSLNVTIMLQIIGYRRATSRVMAEITAEKVKKTQ